MVLFLSIKFGIRIYNRLNNVINKFIKLTKIVKLLVKEIYEDNKEH